MPVIGTSSGKFNYSPSLTFTKLASAKYIYKFSLPILAEIYVNEARNGFVDL